MAGGSSFMLRPSESIVAALARALRCDLDERDHLYHLAGLAPPPRRAGHCDADGRERGIAVRI